VARCVGTRTDGERCEKNAITGGTVCATHGGSTRIVKARAAVRAEVMRWGLGDSTVDAGEVLLRLVSQSARRAELYADELERLTRGAKTLEEALVGDSKILVGDALEKVGEYIRGMAVLEAQERDRCAGFAAKAVAAGLAERQVRLAERQGALIATLIRSLLDDPELGLSDDQKEAGRRVASKHLRALSGAA